MNATSWTLDATTRRRWTRLWLGASLAVGGPFGGCTSISVAPSCPDVLEVGASGEVRANEQNPGAIPTYRWEVTPPDAGSFANPTESNTVFLAAAEGDAVIRLTAADGLFQVVDECRVTVSGFVDVALSLQSVPPTATVGEPVLLVCLSTGQTPVGMLAIVQTGGPAVDLTGAAGTGQFTPTEVATLTFTCAGEDVDGTPSPPAVLTVPVVAAPADNANVNANGATPANDNGAANANTNASTNGNANASAGDNANMNTATANRNNNAAGP